MFVGPWFSEQLGANVVMQYINGEPADVWHKPGAVRS